MLLRLHGGCGLTIASESTDLVEYGLDPGTYAGIFEGSR